MWLIVIHLLIVNAGIRGKLLLIAELTGKLTLVFCDSLTSFPVYKMPTVQYLTHPPSLDSLCSLQACCTNKW